jgi:hypothetical protein
LLFADGGTNSYGLLSLDGTTVETQLTIPNSNINFVAMGPDGALWFTDVGTNAIGHVQPVGGTPSPLVAAVLPASRSLEVGGVPGTVFATVINSGTTQAMGCAIAPVNTVAAGFNYQTTDPATNALTGTLNTPVNIAPDADQTFVISLTPNAPFVPINALFGFSCSNVQSAAPAETGIDTLLVSASATPVPDIVALAATVSNDGILHIPNGAAAFAVATVNVGASSSITATTDTASASLPLALTLCQTNPSSGQCMAPPSTSVTTTIAANATPTFGIFGAVSATIPFAPANSRIFVQFADQNGVVRGSTSVAVETQ